MTLTMHVKHFLSRQSHILAEANEALELFCLCWVFIMSQVLDLGIFCTLHLPDVTLFKIDF